MLTGRARKTSILPGQAGIHACPRTIYRRCPRASAVDISKGMNCTLKMIIQYTNPAARMADKLGELGVYLAIQGKTPEESLGIMTQLLQLAAKRGQWSYIIQSENRDCLPREPEKCAGYLSVWVAACESIEASASEKVERGLKLLMALVDTAATHEKQREWAHIELMMRCFHWIAYNHYEDKVRHWQYFLEIGRLHRTAADKALEK